MAIEWLPTVLEEIGIGSAISEAIELRVDNGARRVVVGVRVISNPRAHEQSTSGLVGSEPVVSIVVVLSVMVANY